MKSISLMHVGDMHLGTKISQFSAEKNMLRMMEIQNTALNVLDKSDEFDIVLFPGDVFDTPDTSEKIADAFLNAVSTCTNTMFFYACGNHDPYISPIVDYCVRNCPPNLYIFGYEEVECVTVEQYKVRIYGISFENNHTPESLLNFNSKCNDEYINILCVHGVLGKDESEPYNPISLQNVCDAGFDYVALGHVHTYSGILNFNSMHYAYSGNIEPRRYDEIGPRGIICGNLNKYENSLQFISCSKREYVEKNLDISDITEYSSLIYRVSSMIENKENIYHFYLRGVNNISHSINTELIIKNIDVFGIRISDLTTKNISIHDFAEDMNLKGECARETLRLCESNDTKQTELYEKACLILFDIFDGREE